VDTVALGQIFSGVNIYCTLLQRDLENAVHFTKKRITFFASTNWRKVSKGLRAMDKEKHNTGI
jgi:hypothetical protein